MGHWWVTWLWTICLNCYKSHPSHGGRNTYHGLLRADRENVRGGGCSMHVICFLSLQVPWGALDGQVPAAWPSAFLTWARAPVWNWEDRGMSPNHTSLFSEIRSSLRSTGPQNGLMNSLSDQAHAGPVKKLSERTSQINWRLNTSWSSSRNKRTAPGKVGRLLSIFTSLAKLPIFVRTPW